MNEEEVLDHWSRQCPWPITREGALLVRFLPSFSHYVWVCLESTGQTTLMTVDHRIPVRSKPCLFARAHLPDQPQWVQGLQEALNAEPLERRPGLDGMMIHASYAHLSGSIWSPSRDEHPLFCAWVDRLITVTSQAVTDGEMRQSIVRLRSYLRD